MKALQSLFQRLRQAKFTIRPSKCILRTNNVGFTGHRLSEGVGGLHEDNVRKINEASHPTTKKQFHSFMALINYYREYVHRFAAVTAFLTEERTAKHTEMERASGTVLRMWGADYMSRVV
ncbi:hypothetical protein RRG08_065680 [Elysia crispata]|uniref:Reverse transcriptase/retrotransposon-derived protein RNase H-like domain-containing protein n=1 Tax=Elysia crispata TaxID=231223 RepID=A0AAE1E0C8_9GAST|nr:hypothetical protein RRG08_065680 [Elysia crispata]